MKEQDYIYQMPTMREIIVTPSSNSIGSVSSNLMLYDLLQAKQARLEKRLKDTYRLHHNMSLTGANIAKGIFEAASIPASFNPVIGTALGAVYTTTAAKDINNNKLNWSNGLQLGLSALPLGRGAYKGASQITKKITYPWEAILKLTILGPNNLLQDWSGRSGPEISYTSKLLKHLFNKTKSDIKSYIKGEEFKLRVMNTGKFTEDEYNLLLLEIELELQKTKYVGRRIKQGANNRGYGTRTNQNQLNYKHHFVTLHPKHSLILHRANIWHEIWHSIGGSGKNYASSHPLLYKLQRFNEFINPTKLSKAMDNADDYRRITIKGGDINEELRMKKWLTKNIVLQPEEVRSRMLSTLDRLRSLGYDTKELINNPDKFREWINEIKKSKVLMPWDTNHLLETYHISDLSNYASKMLVPTGAVYLSDLLMNVNSSNNNK